MAMEKIMEKYFVKSVGTLERGFLGSHYSFDSFIKMELYAHSKSRSIKGKFQSDIRHHTVPLFQRNFL